MEVSLVNRLQFRLRSLLIAVAMLAMVFATLPAVRWFGNSMRTSSWAMVTGILICWGIGLFLLLGFPVLLVRKIRSELREKDKTPRQ
ncbi:MAG: hypothetical protein AB7O68_17880 [Pirellulales bacterium]